MRPLVIALATILGWIALREYSNGARVAPASRSPDAFPFPTAQSHSRIENASLWTDRLGASQEQILAAIKAVGNSEGAVREHLGRAPSGARQEDIRSERLAS